MSSRPVLTALLVAGLAGPVAASSWIFSDPEADALRQELAHAKRTILALRARQVRLEKVLIGERDTARSKVEVLRLANQYLGERLAEVQRIAYPQAPERGWSQAIEELRRDGDVNVGLIPILERMDARGRSSHRLRGILHRLARYDGVLEAALETPAPERELVRFGLILNKVEAHADRLAADVVRRLEQLQDDLGAEFSPAGLSHGDLEDGDLIFDGDDDFGDF